MAFVRQGGEEQGVSKDNLAQKRKKEGKLILVFQFYIYVVMMISSDN